MKIKKYIVNSIDEALSKIKKELGNDAYILTTKKIVTSGALNLSRKNMLEVTAAVDNNNMQKQAFDLSDNVGVNRTQQKRETSHRNGRLN